MKAILSISADPVTYGHIDVIRRAKKVFDELIVVIAINPDKKYTFTLEEREDLTRNALIGMNVQVASYSGLLVDFARLNDVKLIIRSLRDAQDYNYEKMLNDVNSSQQLGIDTVVFFAQQSLNHVSSSTVKELQKHHGSLHEYVPLVVKEALERKMSEQVLIGITGDIGAGKSYITNLFLNFANDLVRDAGLTCTNIDMDAIARKILTELSEPLFISTRQRLIERFNDITNSNNDTFIDVKKLTNIIFKEESALQDYNKIMEEPIIFQFRHELKGLKGLIFVNCALIAEAGISYLTNNNVIIIKADTKVRIERLRQRGYLQNEINDRLGRQFSFDQKVATIKSCIGLANHGNLLMFDNSDASITSIRDFFKQVLQIYNVKMTQ